MEYKKGDVLQSEDRLDFHVEGMIGAIVFGYYDHGSYKESDHYHKDELKDCKKKGAEEDLCKNCYGKGYATRMYHEIGSADFLGDKGWKELKEEKVQCKCQSEKGAGRWKPEKGEDYFFFNDELYPIENQWDENGWAIGRYEAGNCFKTEKEAEAAAEKVKELLLSLHK